MTTGPADADPSRSEGRSGLEMLKGANVTVERIYDAENEQRNAMNAVADKSVTQSVMASFYADCLLGDGRRGRIDWLSLNAAIIARWPKGFVRIKEMAWKEVRTGKPAFYSK